MALKKIAWCLLVVAIFAPPHCPLYAQEQKTDTKPPSPSAPSLLIHEGQAAPEETAKTKGSYWTTPGQSQEEVKNTVEVEPEVIASKLPSYSLNLKKLIEEAEKNIKTIDGEIGKKEVFDRNKERENRIRDHYERGNLLYSQGKLKEAKIEWLKALEISKDPEMKEYVRNSAQRMMEEEMARKKAEEDEKRRHALAEAKAKEERSEKERLEKEALEEEHALAEAKAKEKERLAREEGLKKRQEEEARLAEEKKLAEAAAKAEEVAREKEAKENERLVKEKQTKIAALYDEAIAYYENGHFDLAKEAFARILSIDPEEAKAKEYIEKKIPGRIKEIELENERREAERVEKDRAAAHALAAAKAEAKARAAAQAQAKAMVEAKAKEEELAKAKALEEQKAKAKVEAENKRHAMAAAKAEAKAKEDARLAEERKAEAAEREKDRLEKERLEKEAKENALAKARKLAEKKEFKKQIDPLYDEAIAYYENGHFDLAKETFARILSIDPEEAKAKEYIEKKIPGRIKEIEAEAKRREAARIAEEERLAEKAALEQIRKEELAQKEAEAKLKEEAHALAEAKAKQELIRKEENQRLAKERNEKLNTLYREGVQYYNSDQLDRALDIFLQIIFIDPTQAKARDYIDQKIPAKLNALEIEKLR